MPEPVAGCLVNGRRVCLTEAPRVPDGEVRGRRGDGRTYEYVVALRRE
jgi:hypothetical protein